MLFNCYKLQGGGEVLTMLLLCSVLTQTSGAAAMVLDMTYVFDNQTIYWPTAKSFNYVVTYKGPSGDIPWYEAGEYSAADHGGTHIDAPSHFAASQSAAQGQWSVDQIPISHLVAPAIKIDISTKAKNNADYELSVNDITDWEKVNGQIPKSTILFIYTGWGKFWQNRTAYLGTPTKNTSLLHFPGISPAASQWIVSNRQIYGMGIDTASMDHGPSVAYQTHLNFFSKNIYGLENVAKLDQLPITGATIHALPLLIGGGSGAPCRIIAEWGTNTSTADSTSASVRATFVMMLIVFIFVL